MAPIATVVAVAPAESRLDASQTLRASTALLRKMQTDEDTTDTKSGKANLLADTDGNEAEDGVPVWLILTTKKHVLDKKRLKPTKIVLPHPSLNIEDESLRVCLITADPQRKFKDLIAEPSFPVELSSRIQKVIGLEKLKSRYKSYESRRQLVAEYDIFLADDRIVTFLPNVLGKIFYKTTSKRPIPVTLEGRRQTFDEQGNKRSKLSEGGTKVTKGEIKPAEAAHEIRRTLSSTIVHLAPSVTTAVKVGTGDMEPAELQANIETVVRELVNKSIPRKWTNVRSIHIKGPETAALPIWMTNELWEDEQEVLEEAPAPKESKKRKRGAFAEGADANFVEVPGPDGKMRRLEKPGREIEHIEAPPSKKKAGKSDVEDADAEAEKEEKKARKAALKEQKEAVKKAADGVVEEKKSKKIVVEEEAAMDKKSKKPVTLAVKAVELTKKTKKARAKAADLI